MPTTVADRAHIEALKPIELFTGLDEKALARIYADARLRTLRPGTVVFRQRRPAQTFYVVLDGRVRITEVTAEGHTVLLRFIEAGQMLGAMAALEGMTYPVNAEAVVQTRALAWSTRAMATLMDRYPRIMKNAMGLMVQRIGELQQRCIELATQRVEQRIARAILRLIQQAGQRTAEGVTVNMPLSRQDLAELTGTTLYTVSRTLTRWQSQGLVKTGRQRLTVLKPHPLVAIADGL